MTPAAASLFDRPAEPALGAASSWTRDLFGGPITGSICVIAVAFLGLLLMSGRLPLRRGVEVALGCFLLLGAGLLAAEAERLADGVGRPNDVRDTTESAVRS